MALKKSFFLIIAQLQGTDPLIPLNVLIYQNKNFTQFELNEDLKLPLSDSEHNFRTIQGGGRVSLSIKDTIEYTVREKILIHYL